MDALVGVGVAAASGAIYGLIGFFKNKKQEDMFEGFDTQKFVVSVLGSAVIGGIASQVGLTYDAVSTGALGPLVYQTITNLYKTFFK